MPEHTTQKLLQISFPYQGPFGKDMAKAMIDAARSISEEPGLIWKIWTENEGAQEAGGIYLFKDDATARAYLAKHTARLQEMGISEISVKIFDINKYLSEITHGPVRQPSAGVINL